MPSSGAPSRTFLTILNDAALIAIVLEGVLHGEYANVSNVIPRLLKSIFCFRSVHYSSYRSHSYAI